MAWCAASSAAWWRRALAWARKGSCQRGSSPGPSFSSASRAGMIRSRLAWTWRRFSARRNWPLASAWAMRRRLVAACRRWISQELGRGLEVGAGEAGVGVRAVLLGRAAAVAVGEAVADPVEVVLDPLGRRGRGVGVVADRLAGDVDPLGLVAVERFPDGGVVDLGVVAGHVRAGMAEELLHDVLGDAGVDQPGPEGVAELVPGHGDRLAGLVAQADARCQCASCWLKALCE